MNKEIRMKIQDVEKDLKRINELDELTWNTPWHPAKIKYGTPKYKATYKERQQICHKYSELLCDVSYDLPYDGHSPIQDFLKVIINTIKMIQTLK